MVVAFICSPLPQAQSPCVGSGDLAELLLGKAALFGGGDTPRRISRSQAELDARLEQIKMVAETIGANC